MAICEYCGNEFAKTSKSKARFCGTECRLNGMAKARAEKEKQCKYCGKRCKGADNFCCEEHKRISNGIRYGSSSLYTPRFWK